jgi:hypothetical protein
MQLVWRAETTRSPDLRSLSCRWEPYRWLRGHVLTLLVRPLEADALALQRESCARLLRLWMRHRALPHRIQLRHALRMAPLARSRTLPFVLARRLSAIVAAGARRTCRSQDRRVRCAGVSRAAAAQFRSPQIHEYAPHCARLHRGRERRRRGISCPTARAQADRVRHAPAERTMMTCLVFSLLAGCFHNGR